MKWLRFAVLLIVCLFLSTASGAVLGQQLRSPEYQIESGSLIIEPELDQTAADYDVPASFGPDSQKKFEENGYVIISNKDEESLENPFIRLQLDKSQLVFDTAEVSGESLQQNSLNLFGSGASDFILSLRQEEQFRNSFGATITPTTCDKTKPKCTPELAQVWKKAFGFGYRAIGTSLKDFAKPYAFRSLYHDGATGRSSVLFNNALDKSGKKIDFQFKLRPEPQIQTGIYKSTVTITASANY